MTRGRRLWLTVMEIVIIAETVLVWATIMWLIFGG